MVIGLMAAAMYSGAAAQVSSEAEVLFRIGKDLMRDGKFAEACDKFDASQRIEPNVSTLLNLGDCREKNGQLASAWTAFESAGTIARVSEQDAALVNEAARRAKLLEPRLSYLKVSVPASVRIDGLEITRNGVALDAAQWNVELPLDNGAYDIVARAPGHATWTKKARLDGEALHIGVDVPPLDVAPRDVPGSGSSDGGAGLTGKRKIALASATVGVVGLAAGVVFGLKSKGKRSDADDICPQAACSDARAIDLNEEAQSAGRLANIGFGVGAVGVVAGGVLWFMGAPHAPESGAVGFHPVIDPDAVGLRVEGRF